MAKNEVIAILRTFIYLLRAEGISVDRAFLYGSYLSNTATKESDIDLLIVTEDENDDLGIGLTKFKLGNKSEKTLEELKRYTNIAYLRESIMGEPIKKSKKLMFQDIAEKYKILKMEIDNPFTECYKTNNNTIEGLLNGIDDVRSKIRLKQNDMDNCNNKKQDLDGCLSEFKNISLKQVDMIIKSINKIVLS